jgi:hypothetical protein
MEAGLSSLSSLSSREGNKVVSNRAVNSSPSGKGR